MIGPLYFLSAKRFGSAENLIYDWLKMKRKKEENIYQGIPEFKPLSPQKKKQRKKREKEYRIYQNEFTEIKKMCCCGICHNVYRGFVAITRCGHQV